MYKTQYKIDFSHPGVIEAIQEYISIYDLGLLESLSILRLNETINYYGVCEDPICCDISNGYVAGYRIRCAINEGIRYPIRVPDDNILFNKDGQPRKANESIIIVDCPELCIWLTGRTVFDYIKSTDMLESADVTPDSLALNWLEAWRAQSKA